MSRRRGVAAALVATVAILAVAVAAIVLALNGLDGDRPIVARCVATDGDSRATLAPEQAANAALITAIAVERGLPARAATIALATAMQESRLENIDYGDRDSIGLFQQRPSQGWGTVEQIMDPVYSTNTFYDALVQIDGYEDMEITDAAQAVQRSAFPDAYAQHEPMARLFASALTGWSAAALTCQLPPVSDGSGAGGSAAGTVADLAARDLPAVSAIAQDGEVQLRWDAGDATRTPWVLAHWAVATAELTGATDVVVGDQRWSRDDGIDATWSTTDTPAPDGVVIVR